MSLLGKKNTDINNNNNKYRCSPIHETGRYKSVYNLIFYVMCSCSMYVHMYVSIKNS